MKTKKHKHAGRLKFARTPLGRCLLSCLLVVELFCLFTILGMALNSAEDNNAEAAAPVATQSVQEVKPSPAATQSVQAVTPRPVVPEAPPEDVVAEEEALYTEYELGILALIIYQEAGGDACSNETRQMVGEVFLNRVASDLFPGTFYEVATQYLQYGRLYWTGIAWPERAQLPQEAHAVERAYDMATELLSGTVERLLPEDVIFQAEFPQGVEILVERDGLYFCR